MSFDWPALPLNLSLAALPDTIARSLPSSLSLDIPTHITLPKGVTVPTLAVPLLLALLVLVRAGIVGASQSKMEYTVKWNRERLRFPLPPPDTPLAKIREQITEYTQLPAGSFKLVHAGAVMKDDSQPISVYGIRTNSTLAIIGTGPAGGPPPPSSRHEEKAAPKTEESTIAQIRAELSKVRDTLLPDVEKFVATLPGSPSVTSSAPAPTPAETAASGPASAELAPLTQAQETEHLRLGELLLQSLLRLDAVATESEWADARTERKGAVREVQGLLDRLDNTWRNAKAVQAGRT